MIVGNTQKRKMVIVGIDGGTFKVIDPLMKKGKLPNLERILRSGVRGILKSTYPPITAAAWVSFMTGKNPGKHGFFDFREYNPDDYVPSFVPTTKDAVTENVSALHSSRFQGETIWDFLGNSGYEMTVVAVPMTYPAWKINGRMAPGFPSPDQGRPRTYPPEWADEIGQVLDMSSISSFAAVDHSNPDKFAMECRDLVRRKARIILDAVRSGKSDVLSVVFSSTDFAQHFFWKYFEEQEEPKSFIIETIYQEIDIFFGDILNLTENDVSIVVMSDHGFMRHPMKYFNISSWMVKENYIVLKENNKGSGLNIFSSGLDKLLNRIKNKNVKLKMAIREQVSKMPHFMQEWVSKQYFKSNLIDWDQTRTFRFKMYGTVEGIVINRRNRQEKGIVKEGEEYEDLRDEIIMKLLQLKDPGTGLSVVEKAYKREEIYEGEFFDHTPDIIIELAPDYIGGLELEAPVISLINEEVRSAFSGIHDPDGIFVFYGPNFRKGVELGPADIIDVFPTIFYDLNLPIPDDVDGKVIMGAFSDLHKLNEPIYISKDKGGRKSREELSREDEESMKKALDGLGYLS